MRPRSPANARNDSFLASGEVNDSCQALAGSVAGPGVACRAGERLEAASGVDAMNAASPALAGSAAEAGGPGRAGGAR